VLAAELRPVVLEMLEEMANDNKVQPTIIYTHRKNKGGVKEIHEKLIKLINARNPALADKVGWYHGSTTPARQHGETKSDYLRRKAMVEEEDADKRRTVQLDFKARKIDVVVANDAFGMGIDHPNIRRVIEIGSPKSMESLLNHFGRAGRDVRSD
jgi:superfamily II DNA helicase RecQ